MRITKHKYKQAPGEIKTVYVSSRFDWVRMLLAVLFALLLSMATASCSSLPDNVASLQTQLQACQERREQLKDALSSCADAVDECANLLTGCNAR